jgi:hypothetical protein
LGEEIEIGHKGSLENDWDVWSIEKLDGMVACNPSYDGCSLWFQHGIPKKCLKECSINQIILKS